MASLRRNDATGKNEAQELLVCDDATLLPWWSRQDEERKRLSCFLRRG